ncbi:MAG: FAD/NAD(P)-binding oxidoreductase [Bacillota bacterium]
MLETVLVLGGGPGGVVAANVLSKYLPKNYRVILVDRNDSHSFRSSYPLLLVNRRRPAQISRKLEDLSRKGIEFIQAEIEQVRPEARLVETSRGALDYDYLVISLGAEQHPETVPGMAEGSYNPWILEGANRLRRQLASFKRGKIVMFIASLPFSCPPAPYEIMFLLDAYFRKRGLREQVDLTLVTPEPTPEPLAGPKVGDSVRKMMEQRGINLITQARVLSLDPDAKQLVLDHGITVPGDLFIGVPSHWGPSALRHSGLVEEGGWIEVDPETLATRADRVFAVGDAAALKLPVMKVWAPKAGIFAHYQAEVVARNIASLIAGERPGYRYTAKGL